MNVCMSTLVVFHLAEQGVNTCSSQTRPATQPAQEEDSSYFHIRDSRVQLLAYKWIHGGSDQIMHLIEKDRLVHKVVNN